MYRMKNCFNCQYYDECTSCFEELPPEVCDRYKINEKKPKKPTKKSSLCWKCSRLDCSWMKNLEPVAGWDVEKTKLITKTKTGYMNLPSYRVISCPGYVAGRDA